MEWHDPVFDQRHADVPSPLAERLAHMADATLAGKLGRHIYYERLSVLVALGSLAHTLDGGDVDLDHAPSAAERQLGSVIGQAFHQGCALADVAAATGLQPERVVEIGKRTIRGTRWLDRVAR